MESTRTRVLAGLVLVIVLVVLVVGILARPGQPVTQAAAWQLESLVVDGAHVAGVAGHVTTLWASGDKIEGIAVCNGYGATARGSATEFSIVDGIAMTLTRCAADVADFETAYVLALQRLRQQRIAEDQLVLSGSGVELRFGKLSARPTLPH